LKLPNLENGIIEERKLTAYLLSEENPGGKTSFFVHYGFSIEQWEILQAALLTHAAVHEVTHTMPSPHGIKYIIEGELQTPDNRSPQIRAVWIIDTGKDAPRLVTAYPLERKNK
jgi:hypothetical protein